MIYRREIDGLRALAVLPVILFHAGLQTFSGGFVGVDVFFVISGYLITSLILSELQDGTFSLVRFYERRARRILPALLFVMGICTVFAYAWMLPDELENFGQSLVATALFSNNILLILTSGYWALASEFKPLLHTWSLGVEEQYYVLFPLLLMLGWRFFRRRLLALLVVAFVLSLAAAQWGVRYDPDATFYLLPTRAWELVLGSFIAFYSNKHGEVAAAPPLPQILSCLGLALMLVSALFFSSKTPSPSLWTIMPTVGAVLVILYAREGTFVHRLLSNRFTVGVGLISYSAYLWHFPLFAFARVYSVEPPPATVMATLSVATFGLAVLSWKYIETPFRQRGRVSRAFVYSASAIVSFSFVAFGYFLHASHGVPSRMYDTNVATGADIDAAYNMRVFQYKKDSFAEDNRLKLLILGSSFGRDFANMTIENFDLKRVEIVYRDEFVSCMYPFANRIFEELYKASNMIVFGGRWAKFECVQSDIDMAQRDGKKIFFVGTKDFGYNLNWLARLGPRERANRFNPLPLETAQIEEKLSNAVPKENFIPLLSPIMKNGDVPITDEAGRLISQDREHLTKYGALYIGKRALVNSVYGEILKSY